MKKIIKYLINFIFCHFLYEVKYYGIENVKNIEKCILCPNHSHIYDPVWIYTKIDNLHIMAKSELFRNKFYAFWLKYLGAFPIKRGQKDSKSVLHAIKILKKDKKSNLLIFPEGGILKPEKRRKYITDGATYIAAKTELPIIPIYITENSKIFSKIKVRFGEAINVDVNVLKDKELLKQESQKLLQNIYYLEGNEKN